MVFPASHHIHLWNPYHFMASLEWIGIKFPDDGVGCSWFRVLLMVAVVVFIFSVGLLCGGGSLLLVIGV